MVKVRVAGVALDAAGQHVILLKPVDELAGSGSVLPIWIGEQEATSILIAIEGAHVPRPLAHDLMRNLVEAVDAEVQRVEVTRLDGGTFYAEVTLSTPRGDRVVDARPSDAVALASRVGAPIWVDDAVMAEASVLDTVIEHSDEDDVPEAEEVAAVDVAESIDEFKRFIDDVDPEDFR